MLDKEHVEERPVGIFSRTFVLESQSLVITERGGWRALIPGLSQENTLTMWKLYQKCQFQIQNILVIFGEILPPPKKRKIRGQLLR